MKSAVNNTDEETPCLPRADSKELLSVAALMSSIRSGDEQALAQLYDRYSSIVYSVALRVLRDSGAAEDVVQEVFMQLWRSPDAFDPRRGSLVAWMAVMTRNRAIDSLRKRRADVDMDNITIAVEPDLVADAERTHAIEKIKAVLSNMPSAQRSALEMAYFEGLTHVEIAANTGEPLGTIKTRIRSGLLTLRKAFAQ